MSNFRQYIRAALASSLLLLCISLPTRAGFVIDGFALPVTPDALVGAFGGSNSRFDSLPSPVPYPFSNRTTVATAAPAGVISATIGGGQIIDISAFNTGGVVHLNYAAPGGGPVNFFAGGATQFAFDLLSSANNGVLNVTLTANGNSTTGQVPIAANSNPSTVTIPIPQTADFHFASFFDVFFELQGGATSLSIDDLYTTAAVPELTASIAWGMICLSCVGLVRAGRWAL